MTSQHIPQRGWLEKKDDEFLLSRVTHSYVSRCICATPLMMERPVIFGIHWVSDPAYPHKRTLRTLQTMTMSVFRADYDANRYPMLEVSAKNIFKYAAIDVEDGEFNFADCKLDAESAPLKKLSKDTLTNFFDFFRDFVRLIHPPKIIVLGSENIMKLLEITSEFVGESIIVAGEVVGFKGLLWGVPFYSVPHPQKPMSSRRRTEIWDMIFSA